MLLFSSNGEGSGFSESDWRAIQADFIASNKAGKLLELDCAHYLYDIEYERIALETRAFLEIVLK